jgi:hypothetical protein
MLVTHLNNCRNYITGGLSTMHYNRFHLLWILGTCVILNGCSPIYSTRYRYVPPENMDGKNCITRCASINEHCYSSAENRAARERESCEQNAAIRYAACIASAKTDAARNNCSTSTSCNQQAHTKRCDSEYDHCYRTCGGAIEPFNVCVMWCD